MAIAKFSDCRVWPLGIKRLQLRYATLKNPFLSLDCAPRSTLLPWRNVRKGRNQILPSGNHAQGYVITCLVERPLGVLAGLAHLEVVLRAELAQTLPLKRKEEMVNLVAR